jgi:cytidine deaminase
MAAARRAAARAYAPYSGFPVGAAVLGRSGRVHAGCNVENASYGLSICAERSAVFRAIGAGETGIEALVIYTPTPLPTAPCGACRQVLSEFGARLRVLCLCDGPQLVDTTLDALLPSRFGPRDLPDRGRP